MGRQRKTDMNYREFRGGYIKVATEKVQHIIDGYRAGELRRADIRVFAGMLEQRALCKDSRVSLYRIVNTRASDRGKKRLSSSEIDAAAARVGQLQTSSQNASSFEIRVPRKFARHVAQGGCTCVEAVLLLFYCLRRLRQRKRLQRLHEEERYARFRYRELEELSGIARANLCRAMRRLRDRGFIQTAPIAKQNENVYGQLFVDGPTISLTTERRSIEKPTPPRRNDNTPGVKLPTLRKHNPKSTISKHEGLELDQEGWERKAQSARDPFWKGLFQRAAQVSGGVLEQAA